MFVRNYYNILAIGGFKSFANVSSPATLFSDIFGGYEQGSLSLKRMDGTVSKEATYSVSSNALSLIPNSRVGLYSNTQFTSNTSYTGIAFGSGTTPPSSEDYKLESPYGSGVIGEGVSSSNVQISNARYENGKFKADISVLITNKSSSAIQINEFAIGAYYYMLYRAVLAETLTVPANSSATMHYTVEINVA